eukprot:459666-Alexandrium_andersonii.AAC.1
MRGVDRGPCRGRGLSETGWGGEGPSHPPARSSTSGHVRRASGSGALGRGAARVPGLHLAGGARCCSRACGRRGLPASRPLRARGRVRAARASASGARGFIRQAGLQGTCSIAA